MSKRVAHLLFGVAFVLVAASLQPQAEATCTSFSGTTTYYGYITDSDGSFYGCTDLIISPAIAHHWGVVGERYFACDGSSESSGNTSCPNPQTTIHRCTSC